MRPEELVAENPLLATLQVTAAVSLVILVPVVISIVADYRTARRAGVQNPRAILFRRLFIPARTPTFPPAGRKAWLESWSNGRARRSVVTVIGADPPTRTLRCLAADEQELSFIPRRTSRRFGRGGAATGEFIRAGERGRALLIEL